VAWVEAMAFREDHPAPRVESRINNTAAMRAYGAQSLVRAHGAEADVVPIVTGQHPITDQADQLPVKRCPRGCILSDGSGMIGTPPTHVAAARSQGCWPLPTHRCDQTADLEPQGQVKSNFTLVEGTKVESLCNTVQRQ
jgi:hypothetical protein